MVMPTVTTTYFVRDSNTTTCAVDIAKITIRIPTVGTSLVDKDGDGNLNATFRRLSDNHMETVGGSCDGQACIIIPTMSQWGLVIFALLILNLGVFLINFIGIALPD